MDRKPPPNLASNVPIVGQRMFRQVCREGHFEETAHPFQMVIPGPAGEALAVRMCRACWEMFIVDHFAMREVTEEEMSQIEAQLELQLAETEKVS